MASCLQLLLVSAVLFTAGSDISSGIFECDGGSTIFDQSQVRGLLRRLPEYSYSFACTYLTELHNNVYHTLWDAALSVHDVARYSTIALSTGAQPSEFGRVCHLFATLLLVCTTMYCNVLALYLVA